MRVNFYDILSSHSQAYPKMTAQDYYALAFESEFGVAFFGDDDLDTLIGELQKVKNDSLEPCSVDIGGGYSRMNLAAVKQYLGPSTILRMTNMSRRCDGSDDGLKRKLSLISRSAKMGILPAAAEGACRCTDTGHSPVYRYSYGASYRIVSYELARLIPALCLISEALGRGGSARVGIDGRAVSGKTWAKETIEQIFSDEVEGGALTVTEGAYILRDSTEYDVKLYFDTTPEVRRMRLIGKGGEKAVSDYLNDILPEEEKYIAECSPALSCDLIVGT